MRRLVAVLLIAGTVAACGIPEDGDPQAISPENLPPDLINPTSTTLPEQPGSTPVDVYFLDEVGETERLVAVTRRVDDASSAVERLGRLLAQPTEDEADDGITSSIPSGTVLLETSEGPNGELVVNLSPEFLSIEGEGLSKAFAQIVYTVTDDDGRGITQVGFVVDGEPIQALDDEGVQQEGTVGRADYRALAPL
jgi:spore germination protein GerM